MSLKATRLWPGLVRLWHVGELGPLSGAMGTLLAFGFSLLLWAAFSASFLWPELFPVGITWLLWILSGTFWLLGWVDGGRLRRQMGNAPATDDQLDLFLAARGEYLRGEWSRAEHLLERILRADPRDAEARLMLATLLRHVGRTDQARDQLRRLQRLERAGQWNMEIEREWQFLSMPSKSDESDGGPSNDSAAGRCEDGRLLGVETDHRSTGRQPQAA